MEAQLPQDGALMVKPVLNSIYPELAEEVGSRMLQEHASRGDATLRNNEDYDERQEELQPDHAGHQTDGTTMVAQMDDYTYTGADQLNTFAEQYLQVFNLPTKTTETLMEKEEHLTDSDAWSAYLDRTDSDAWSAYLEQEDPPSLSPSQRASGTTTPGTVALGLHDPDMEGMWTDAGSINKASVDVTPETLREKDMRVYQCCICRMSCVDGSIQCLHEYPHQTSGYWVHWAQCRCHICALCYKGSGAADEGDDTCNCHDGPPPIGDFLPEPVPFTPLPGMVEAPGIPNEWMMDQNADWMDNGGAPAFIRPIEEFREYDAGRYFAGLERYLQV